MNLNELRMSILDQATIEDAVWKSNGWSVHDDIDADLLMQAIADAAFAKAMWGVAAQLTTKSDFLYREFDQTKDHKYAYQGYGLLKAANELEDALTEAGIPRPETGDYRDARGVAPVPEGAPGAAEAIRRGRDGDSSASDTSSTEEAPASP